jgi:CubicO group peptidase (beta-lactamase class C family)
VAFRISTALKILAAILLAVVVSILAWAVKPGIDRSLQNENLIPVALSKATLSVDVTAKLTSFIENDAVGTDALVVLKGGDLLFEYGRSDVPTNLHSIRKSVLSVLFGIAIDKGLADISLTLADLGIDEPEHPLTDIEKRATVEHLLQARSGVYIPSGGETQRMREGRPVRGQYEPGEHFYYNNWDFNVAGYIFEQQTGVALGDAIDRWLARPLGMEDFHPSHVEYAGGNSGSQYGFYRIHMSARDLARIGLLIQQKGAWDGLQIVPRHWVERTTRYHSEASLRGYDGYGYLWWLNTDRNVIAGAGSGNQHLHIDRNGPFVIVNRQDTGNSLLGRIWFWWFKYSDDPCDLFKIHDILTEKSGVTTCER